MYLQIKLPNVRDPLSKEQLAKFKRGIDVGKFAQLLFQAGIDCTPVKSRKTEFWLENTQKNLNPFSVLFEAAFEYNQNIAIMDIVEVHSYGIHAFEVKSSLKISPVYELDLAYQSYIIQKSTERLEKVTLIHVNADYVKNDESINWNVFFTQKEYTDRLSNWLLWVEEQSTNFVEILKKDEIPKQSIGKHCFEPYICDFIKFCWKRPIQEKWKNAQVYIDSHSGIFESKGLIARNRESITYEFPFDVVFYIRPAVPVLVGSKPYDFIPILMIRVENRQQLKVLWKIKNTATIQALFNEIQTSYTDAPVALIADSISALILFGEKKEMPLRKEIVERIQLWQSQFKIEAELKLIIDNSLNLSNLDTIINSIYSYILNDLKSV